MIKSIYNSEDLRLTSIGIEAKVDAEFFFNRMLEKYPDHNPRELVEMFSGTFHLQACRRVIELRKSK